MITEETMTHADMLKAVDAGYLCAVCQNNLSVAWGGSWGINGYVLRCSDPTHTGITRHDKKEENKRKEYFSMESTAIMAMDNKAMMERIEMAKFPQELTAPEKKLLAQIAITYGFDPLMGEITIYQGRPFVSIDGRYRKAQETLRLDGVSSRPATAMERAEWQIPDDDYFFKAEVMVVGAKYPFIGWGRVFKAETVGGKGFKPVEKNPQRMAEKRAEAQALRKAFHIPLPSIEDIGSPDTETNVRVIQVLHTGTGEITEETVKLPSLSPPAPTKAEEAPKHTKPSPRDVATIKNVADLTKALFEDFKLQPKQQLAELNLESWNDLTVKPSEAYSTVAESRK